MTEFKKNFVDTSPLIYFIEKDPNNPQYCDKIKSLFAFCFKNKTHLVTSILTIHEYMVYPYKNQRMEIIESFERLLDALSFEVINIDKSIEKMQQKL